MAKKQKTENEEPGTEVVNWEDQMAEAARDVAKTERPSVNKITFQSGVMTYMDVAMADNTLDCIVVAAVSEHVFYTEKWRAGVVKPPACFALGPSGQHLFPHEDVPEPQNDNCTGCSRFEWGSDLEGGRGKACAERRRLAVIPAPANLEDMANSDMAAMSIPVTSVKQWANYVNKLSATTQRPPWGVLTKVMLVPDAKSQFKVKFEFLRPLTSEELPLVHGRIEVAEASLMIPYEMAQQGNSQKEEGDSKY